MALPWKWRKRRVVLVILGLALLYLFVHNIPTDLQPIDERFGKPLRPGHVVHGAQEAKEPRGAPPRSAADDDEGERMHYYNGPIKFFRLATTLRGISRTSGSRTANRNILFAASSLKSVANLMPMACEMGKVDRTYVHMALLGRDPLPLEDILEINGVDKDSCTVYFHDARGDFTEFSSDMRAEVSVSGAMRHINDFMHPQAIIMDDSTQEDAFFIRAMRRKAKELGRALIEVPANKYEEFLWMTKLDSGSLASWFSPSIDILIQAPAGSSGGLIRLLKSLQRADYAGLKPPRLTIELPNDIEPFAKHYIEWLDWPPDDKASPLRTNALSLRHRIPTGRVNSEQASLRFVEGFFPTSTSDDHVLILSPQSEVHPLYLQYLYYLILEYRYSSYGVPGMEDLLGLALDVPTTFLNGSSGFGPPHMDEVKKDDTMTAEEIDSDAPAPFLYQAPSADASLIFGDKWTEFHNFLSRRLQLAEAGKAEKHVKQVAETQPAWMEYLLELISARAWTMLHPATPMATVHSELAHIPEEYLRETKSPSPPETQPSEKNEPFLTADEPPTLPSHPESQDQDTSSSMPLHKLLPFDGELPQFTSLPHVYRNGKLFTPEGNAEFQDTYTTWFREHLGGCDKETAKRERVAHWLSADDLFCVPGIPEDFLKEGEGEASDTEKESKDVEKGEKGGGVKDGEAADAGEADESSEGTQEPPNVQV
jgi:hypothetical protein